MFIDFEGIEGSGREILTRRVAERLRQRGYRINVERQGTANAVNVAKLRGDEPGPMERCARAELLQGLAAQAQAIETRLKPALERGEVCLEEGYLFGPLAHAAAARGLPLSEVQPVVSFAAQGMWPDLVVLVDVDPELAALRARAGDAVRQESTGAAMRASLQELARRDPSRWVVVVNEDVAVEDLADSVAELVVARLEVGAPEVRPLSGRRPERRPVDLRGVEGAFFEAVDALSSREPSLALHLLTGLPGLAAHGRRVRLLEAHPQDALRSLAGLQDSESFRIREIAADLAPVAVAKSLGTDSSGRAMALRERLFEAATADVVAGLVGDGSEAAWALRERALAKGEWRGVLLGLAGVDGDRAWELRREGRERGLLAEVARSLGGLTSTRADAVREALIGRVPLDVLEGLRGLDTPFGRTARQRLFAHAPAKVLCSLVGVEAPYAWALRVRAVPTMQEALESVTGMNHEEAWVMRARWSKSWPCAAISSLGSLAGTPRGMAFLEQVLSENPGRLAVWRSAWAVFSRAVDEAAAALAAVDDGGEEPWDEPTGRTYRASRRGAPAQA